MFGFRLPSPFRRRAADAARPRWARWFGDRGEREAARVLRRGGMTILVRGYRTDRGEVDLIARDGGVLVFVEVKTRRRGMPAEAVTPEKQRRITAASLHFLKRHGLLDGPKAVPCRFDVVAVVWPEGGGRPSVEHIRDAFDAVGPRGQFFR